MLKDLYAKPDFTKKVQFQTDEKKTTDAEDDNKNATIYDNYVTERNNEDLPQEHQQTSTCMSVCSVRLSLLSVCLICLPVCLLHCKNYTELISKTIILNRF